MLAGVDAPVLTTQPLAVHQMGPGKFGPERRTAQALYRPDALTRALAQELRDRDITVNGVSLQDGHPRRPGRIADIVAYLLSDAGHGITGHVIHLDDRPWGPAGNAQ